MSKALNEAFTRQPNGLTNFLHRRPMLVEIQDVVTDKVFNPNMGTEAEIRTPLTDILVSTTQPSKNLNVRVLSAQVMYCDFNMYSSLVKKGVKRDRLVIPQIDFSPSGNKVPMYYLPWKEDMRFSMKLGNKAEYFMTAGMHGCKFEVNYDAKSKETIVSHSNIQPTGVLPGQGNSWVQEHVRTGLDKLTNDDHFANKCPHVLTFGKVDYFWDALRETGRINQTMMGYGIQPDEIVEASPSAYQANVVGRRVGDNWTFYYQLTLMVDCSLKEQVKKKKWLGLKTSWTEARNSVKIDVVVAVKRIWPGVITNIPLQND